MLRACLVSCVLLLAACGTGRFHVSKFPDQPFGKFGPVVVEPVRVSPTAVLGDGARELADGAASQVTNLMAAEFANAGGMAASNGLRLRAAIIELDPGSQVARYLLGFGSGKGHIALDVSFVDDRGAVVAAGTAKGTVSGGFFGGVIERAYERAADAVVSFHRRNREEVVSRPPAAPE